MSNTIYGYCRISRPTQDINRQIRNIKEAYKDVEIIEETYTGTKVYGRKEFNRLINKVKSGDTIVFDSVSRMSRNADEGIALYLDLFKRDITLVFLKEPHINSDTYKSAINQSISLTGDDVDDILKGINSYLKKLATKQIRLAFEQAEKEVTDLQQRTSEGIRTAKLKGKRIGRAANASVTMRRAEPIKELIKAKSKDFSGTNTDKDVIAILDKTKIKIKNPNGTYKEVTAHVSRNTYYKYKSEIINELNAEQAAE